MRPTVREPDSLPEREKRSSMAPGSSSAGGFVTGVGEERVAEVTFIFAKIQQKHSKIKAINSMKIT